MTITKATQSHISGTAYNKEVTEMREYEIRYKETNEIDFWYAYSKKDLLKRYAHIDPSSYEILGSCYVD